MARDKNFPLETCFPDSGNLFSDFLLPAESIIGACTVYLDANTLLLPYKLDNSSHKALIEAYEKLAVDDRIFIPAQAGREFVKNRGHVIAEIVKALRDKKNRQSTVADIPILKHFDLDQRFKEQQAAINKANVAINELLDQAIASLATTPGHDPITKAYNRIFSSRIIELDAGDRKDFLEDLQFRSAHKLPPGYQDGGKSDGGAGDLIVWKTIISKSKVLQKDAVFVTGEKKPDWFDRVDKEPFSLRFELYEEFRKETGGRSIHVMPTSEFLRLMHASQSIVTATANLEASSSATATVAILPDTARESLIEEVFRNSGRAGTLWGIIQQRRTGFDNGEPITLQEAEEEFDKLTTRNEDIKRILESGRRFRYNT